MTYKHILIGFNGIQQETISNTDLKILKNKQKYLNCASNEAYKSTHLNHHTLRWHKAQALFKLLIYDHSLVKCELTFHADYRF